MLQAKQKLIFKLIMKEEIRIPFQLDILLSICPKIFDGNYKQQNFKKENCNETCLPGICVKVLALKDILFNFD